MVATEVRHLNLKGQTLSFFNPEGLYPVNQYQSLVLATASEYAAVTLSARRRRPLAELAAWEPCCGGGPVAVSMKHLGLGYVQASDINPDALAACRANAARNGVTLDAVKTASLLADGDSRRYDLIACNPPCGVGPHSDFGDNEAIRQAVSGGAEGMELTRQLLHEAAGRLAEGGSLVFVVVSTGNVRALSRWLDELFPCAWRAMAGTPVAAPYAPADDPRITLLTQPSLGYEPLVWQRGDGWYWRLTWILEARVTGWSVPPHSGFPLCPLGQEVSRDAGLQDLLRRSSDDGFWLRRSGLTASPALR
jgi:predicted RNA methylase